MSNFQAIYHCYKSPMTKDEVRARLKELAKKDFVKLKKDIVEYNLKREKIIMEMENNPDPEFRKQLAMYKKNLGPREFCRHRLKIYALCNKNSMARFIPLDYMQELPKVEENSEDES